MNIKTVTDQDLLDMMNQCRDSCKTGYICEKTLPMCSICTRQLNKSRNNLKPVPFSSTHIFMDRPGKLKNIASEMSHLHEHSIVQNELPVDIQFNGKQYLHSFEYTQDVIRDVLKVVLIPE
jgi:hypothetical protein